MKEKGYYIDGGTIVVNRELNKLDLFLKDFLEVLRGRSDYLVVSGFVSISTGRTRGTEDIDVLFPVMGKEDFGRLFGDLIKNGFWCYQGDSFEEVYEYVENMNNIRFARVDEMFPNIEFIPIDETKEAKFFEFSHPQKIKISDFEFKIPPLEFEILYKEIVLASEKDIADAMHLRTFFKDILKNEKFKEYESIVRKELK
tara:strand:- start:1751 stop:2347 length:597 start_codon:yes stop_codon:yes gene_type:complete